MTSVLVTGASGFLGRHVVAALRQRAYRVRAMVRADTHRGGLFADDVEVVRCDLRRPATIAPTLTDIDAVVHLAAVVEGDDENQFAGTVVGTENLLTAMSETGVRRMIHISSLSVYDWSGRRKILDEQTPLESDLYHRDGYAVAKSWQERVVRETAARQHWELTVLRPGFIWGRDREELAGIGLTCGPLQFVIGAVRHMPLTYVENCADCIATVLASPAAVQETFNVVDDQPPGVWRYAGKCFRRRGRRAIRVYVPYWAGLAAAHAATAISKWLFRGAGKLPSFLVPLRFRARFRPLRFSNEKLKRLVGWSSSYAFDDAWARAGQRRPLAGTCAVERRDGSSFTDSPPATDGSWDGSAPDLNEPVVSSDSRSRTSPVAEAAKPHAGDPALVDPLRIGYITSYLGRVSDTFIRNEIVHLRRLGCEVQPFSIRRPEAELAEADELLQIQQQTEYVLESGLLRLMLSGFAMVLRHPRRSLSAALLAWSLKPPGVKHLMLHGMYWLEAAHVARRITALRLRHLHNHIGENSATVATLAGRLADVTVSMTIHGSGVFYAPAQWALGQKIAHNVFTACVSDFCRSQCMVFASPADWRRLVIVRCAVQDEFLLPPPRRGREGMSFVNIGRLCEVKGQLLLLAAASELAAEGRDFEVTLIGDGPLRAELEQVIRSRGLQDHVRLAGWRDSSYVRDAIMSARAFVLPSFAEGLPVVLMEALALECPVITSCLAGIPELVEHEKSGWLIPAGSVSALTAAMRSALDASPERLQQMGAHGARRVRARHHPRREAEKLLQLFRCAVATGTIAHHADGGPRDGDS